MSPICLTSCAQLLVSVDCVPEYTCSTDLAARGVEDSEGGLDILGWRRGSNEHAVGGGEIEECRDGGVKKCEQDVPVYAHFGVEEIDFFELGCPGIGLMGVACYKVNFEESDCAGGHGGYRAPLRAMRGVGEESEEDEVEEVGSEDPWEGVVEVGGWLFGSAEEAVS